MIKRMAFVMMCLSLLGMIVSVVAVIQHLGPVLYVMLC